MDRSFACWEVENDQSLSLCLSPTPGESDTSKALADSHVLSTQPCVSGTHGPRGLRRSLDVLFCFGGKANSESFHYFLVFYKAYFYHDGILYFNVCVILMCVVFSAAIEELRKRRRVARWLSR